MNKLIGNIVVVMAVWLVISSIVIVFAFALVNFPLATLISILTAIIIYASYYIAQTCGWLK